MCVCNQGALQPSSIFFPWISTLLSLGDCWCLASRAPSPGAVPLSTELCMWGDLPLPLAQSRFHALCTQTYTLHACTHSHTHLERLHGDTCRLLRCFKLTMCAISFNGPIETQTITFAHMNHHKLPCPHGTHTHMLLRGNTDVQIQTSTLQR